jgi:hypothetical protein
MAIVLQDNGSFHELFPWDAGSTPSSYSKTQRAFANASDVLKTIIPLIEKYNLPIEIRR